jgi:tungstate transport system permease protein
MQLLWDGLAEALRMIFSADPLVIDAAVRTLIISFVSVALAALLALPQACWLSQAAFPGKRFVVLGIRTAMALPTVFVGVVCYALFTRHGVLGPLGLLYTPTGIVLGELALAVPIVLGVAHGAIESLDPRVAETANVLGASRLRLALTLISEARVGVLLALLTAFARCVSELGIAMIVGGNIKYHTRTLATATALETSKGDFSRGLAMGILLMLIALAATAVMGWLSQEHRR